MPGCWFTGLPCLSVLWFPVARLGCHHPETCSRKGSWFLGINMMRREVHVPTLEQAPRSTDTNRCHCMGLGRCVPCRKEGSPWPEFWGPGKNSCWGVSRS